MLGFALADGVEEEVAIHSMQADGLGSTACNTPIALVHEELGDGVFELHERVVHDVELADAVVENPEVSGDVNTHVETFLDEG